MIKLDTTLFDSNDRILLAVSGGVDSMVMFNLFYQLDRCDSIAVAHCNFSLRGEESDEDSLLVEQFAHKLGVKLHYIKFDTIQQMKLRGLTMQECARELRYEWFEELCSEYNYTKIATAHNLNDSVETFFINSTRGCGARGLTGISRINQNIIRPLGDCTREQIEHYAHTRQVPYRDDRSNFSDKYLRNDIRHNIIPVMIRRNDNYLRTMQRNMKNISEMVDFIDLTIDSIAQKHLISEGEVSILNIEEISHYPMSQYILYETLTRWGFSREVSNSILSSYKDGGSGKQYISNSSYTASINRGKLEIGKPIVLPQQQFKKADSQVEWGSWHIEMRTEQYDGSRELRVPPDQAIFDYDKLSEQLTIRPWINTDSFQPFGMKGSKLVSDLMIDKKLSLFQKQSTPILVDDSQRIVWVVGLRTAAQFSVSDSTKRVLICKVRKID